MRLINPNPPVEGNILLNISCVAGLVLGATPVCNEDAKLAAGCEVYALAAIFVGAASIMLNGLISIDLVAVPESPTIGLNAWANLAASYIGV